MSTEFTKQLEIVNKEFKKLAHLKNDNFNASLLTKFDGEATSSSAFGDSREELIAMLFNSFVTHINEIDDFNIQDLVLTLIVVTDTEINEEFIQALTNMAIKSKSSTVQ